MKLIIEKKITLFFFLAAIALLFVLVLFYSNTQKLKLSNEVAEHTQDVLRKNDDILFDILNIETGFRGFLISGNDLFLKPYIEALKKIDKHLNELGILVAENPHQSIQVDSLRVVIARRMEFTNSNIEKKRLNILDENAGTEIIGQGKYLNDKIRSINANIKLEELNLLNQRKIENSAKNNYFKIIFLTLIALISFLFVIVLNIIKKQKIRNIELEEFTISQKLLSNYALSLIEASLDPLLTISPEGKITDMNQATVNYTGINRETLRGTDFFDYFTDPQKAREVYQEVFAKGSVADSPLTLRHIQGKLTEVLFNGSVYKDDRGNVVGIVIVARDITDQKRIETELTEAIVFAEMATGIAENAKIKAEGAKLIAENAMKAKQQFLSNMSHEIRTPMNAIIGFTKVLLKTDLTLKQKEFLTAIKMSGDALIVLINDILDLAKVDAGKMTFEQIPFKLSLSIAAMVHLFETKIQEKNLELFKEYDPAIPDVLVGDPVRLHQIIINLVSNAVKFTNTGKITVSVRLLNEDAEKVNIEFAVSDTGIGIAANKIDKIFEDFQQASSGTSRLYGGTGLGLAIVKKLVEPQGGSISVESKTNVGSTFSFILPFLKTKLKAETETAMVEVDEEIKDISVLVAEDITLNQMLMRTLLDDFGFKCDIAANGKIAIEKLQTNSYDIILMDLQMPEMNGFEATEHIRYFMNSEIPIIALTADVTTVDLAKCKSVGMNDYIAKPVDERVLYSKIMGLVKNNKIPKVKVENEGSKKVNCTNLEYLNHRTKSNPKLMMEMISAYLKQTPLLINAMKISTDEKEWDSLQAVIHKLIPSFSIVGISPDFETMARKVMKNANTNENTDEIPGLVLQLEEVCIQACSELEEEFNMIKTTNK